jgi:hypothetical protein
MNQNVIFGLFFALMLTTLVVWIYMYARRIPFIVTSKLRLVTRRRRDDNMFTPRPMNGPSHGLRSAAGGLRSRASDRSS